MVETAVVTKTENNKAIIELSKKASCEECKICKFNGDKVYHKIKNKTGLKTGDKIFVEITKGFSFSFLQIIIPIVLLVSDYFITLGKNLTFKIVGVIVASVLSIISIIVCEKTANRFKIEIRENDENANNK